MGSSYKWKGLKIIVQCSIPASIGLAAFFTGRLKRKEIRFKGIDLWQAFPIYRVCAAAYVHLRAIHYIKQPNKSRVWSGNEPQTPLSGWDIQLQKTICELLFFFFLE